MVSRDNPEFLSAESLMDDKVINTDGEDLGKFEDLMIDLADGRIAYAALSFGGLLGMGSKLFAIPWKALTLRVHEHAFVLDVPKEVLKEAEGFEKDNWPATSRESLTTMYGYYGYTPYWETGTSEGVQLPGHTVSETITRTRSGAGEAGSGFLRATKIQGEKVVNREGDHLGKIEDIMIDLQDGRIAYAVISHGGILGLGSKHIAIPWQGLMQRTRDNEFILDIPKETLDKAEGLDKDKWPVTREELSRTFSYYGYQPYWPTGAAAAGVAGASAAAMGAMESKRTRKIETTEPGIMETQRVGMTEAEEERKARMEREKLEGLKETEQERLARLERERVQTKEQAEAQREKLMSLEREQVELERQAQAERERLAKLEREMEEARRREETQKVTRLEEEARMLQTQETTRRERLSQLEAERSGLQRQTETEQERVARLEKERMEAERREAAEKERLAQLERERMNLDKQAETEQERLARLERDRTEIEKRAVAERERMDRLESERMQTQTTVVRSATTEGAVPHFLSASTIRSDRVVNTAGEDLGKIEELMIDLQDGRVAYAVLSFGGFMGMADKLFAIPWQALSLRAHEHAFTLDIPREVLERAEGFDKNNWPLSREELSRTYTYYGYQPYWQTTGMGRTDVSTGTMRKETEYRGTTSTQREELPLETAEERIARQEKERIENLERKERDQEKIERLEKDKMIAERRENKYK